MSQGRRPHPDILTPRQWEVLGCIREGLTDAQIADRLGISLDGAKYHVSEILSKLGVSSREEAVLALAGRSQRTDESRWALWLRAAAVVGAAIVLVGSAALALGVLLKGDDEPSVPADISVTDVYSRALAGATRSDSILHISFEQVSSDNGSEKQVGNGEMWVDAAGDKVRRESNDLTDPNSARGHKLTIAANGYLYSHFDSPALGSRASRSEFRSLCGTESTAIAAIFSCGVDPRSNTGSPADVASLVDTHAQFEGRPAIEVIFGPAIATATPEIFAGAYATQVYFDRATFLPIGEITGFPLASTTRYQPEFTDKSAVDGDYLDPISIGYGLRDPDAKRAEIATQVKPYWLGAQYVVYGSSEYVLMDAELANASGGQTASLEYNTPDGHSGMSIYLWTHDDWNVFFAKVNSNLLSMPGCSTQVDVTAGARTYLYDAGDSASG